MNKNEIIKNYYGDQLKQYQDAKKRKDFDQAWSYLQRAHILSQTSPRLHKAIHVEMIRFAWAEKNWRELRGQIPRILLAGVGSLLGRAPKGNPGTSDYAIFQKHPLPEDLAQLIDGQEPTQ